SPERYVTPGVGGSGGLWVRTNVGPEKGDPSSLDAAPRSLLASILSPTSSVRRPTSMAPVAAAISVSQGAAGAMKSKIQSIASSGPAMKPSSDIDLFTTTLPVPVRVSLIPAVFLGCSDEREKGAGFQAEPFLDHAVGTAGFEDRMPVLYRFSHGWQQH